MLFKVYSKYYDRTSGLPMGNKGFFQEQLDTLQSRVFKGIQTAAGMKDKYEEYYNRPENRKYKNGKLLVNKVIKMNKKDNKIAGKRMGKAMNRIAPGTGKTMKGKGLLSAYKKGTMGKGKGY